VADTTGHRRCGGKYEEWEGVLQLWSLDGREMPGQRVGLTVRLRSRISSTVVAVVGFIS
jgi:hypothetical protein